MNVKRPAVSRSHPCPKCGADEWRARSDRGFFCAPCVRLRFARWRAKNVGKCKEAKGKWYKANADKERARLRRYRAANPERIRSYSQRWHEKNREQSLWFGARQRALKAGLPFTIIAADIVIPSHCPVLGIPLAFSTVRPQKDGWSLPGRAAGNSPSVDRINPALGYVPGNIAVISWRANRLKSDATAAELRRIAEWMDSCPNVQGQP